MQLESTAKSQQHKVAIFVVIFIVIFPRPPPPTAACRPCHARRVTGAGSCHARCVTGGSNAQARLRYVSVLQQRVSCAVLQTTLTVVACARTIRVLFSGSCVSSGLAGTSLTAPRSRAATTHSRRSREVAKHLGRSDAGLTVGLGLRQSAGLCRHASGRGPLDDCVYCLVGVEAHWHVIRARGSF